MRTADHFNFAYAPIIVKQSLQAVEGHLIEFRATDTTNFRTTKYPPQRPPGDWRQPDAWKLLLAEDTEVTVEIRTGRLRGTVVRVEG